MLPPDSVGRYEVGVRLGAGGMGVVYSAYDPKLARNVALKLLRSRANGQDERDRQRDRMLREARAMARLKHSNVVVVHDADEFPGGVYIAMELVVGTTLHQWLRERRREWREILEMFVQAGQGLNAAHAARLIHRDFKPENVLIDLTEHRALVTDFGLVRDGADGFTLESVESASSGSDGAAVTTGARLTRKSEIFGTREYMSPEQYQSADVDARSDQFSFCLALYEALYHLDLRVEGPRLVNDWQVDPPPDSEVPVAVLDVLRRGLQLRPEVRWPSLSELLAALDKAANPTDAQATSPPVPNRRARRRSRVIWSFAILGGAVAVLGASFFRKSGECYLQADPDAMTYTPPFVLQTRCGCSPQSQDCHQLYQGRVLRVHGPWADLEFKKVTGGPPTKLVRYWVLYGDDAEPVCDRLNEYEDATSGYWTEHQTTLIVDNVPIWPTEEEFAAAPPGNVRTVFLTTGDGAGDTHARVWYQPQGLTFTKVCGLRLGASR